MKSLQNGDDGKEFCPILTHLVFREKTGVYLKNWFFTKLYYFLAKRLKSEDGYQIKR